MTTLQEEAQNFHDACVSFLNCIAEELYLYKFLDYLTKKLNNIHL